MYLGGTEWERLMEVHNIRSVRITRLDDGEKLGKREYSRELLSIYGESLYESWNNKMHAN